MGLLWEILWNVLLPWGVAIFIAHGPLVLVYAFKQVRMALLRHFFEDKTPDQLLQMLNRLLASSKRTEKSIGCLNEVLKLSFEFA